MRRIADRALLRLGLRVQMCRGILFQADAAGAEGQDQKLDELTFGAVDATGFETDPIFAEKGRRESFPKQASRGHRCFGFFDERGAIASYIWVTGDTGRDTSVPFVFTGLSMPIPPGSGYIWDCFTSPEFRNRGLYRNGLREGMAICAREGIDHVYIACESDNIASVKGILAAGFREKLRYRGLRVGPICLVKRSDRRIELAKIGATWKVLGGEATSTPRRAGQSSRGGPGQGVPS